jgi:hypothetical protein
MDDGDGSVLIFHVYEYGSLDQSVHAFGPRWLRSQKGNINLNHGNQGLVRSPTQGAVLSRFSSQ